MNKLQFTTEINATNEEVWKTLWDDKTFRQWASIIDPETYMVGDLREGSEVQFISAANGYGVTSLVGILVKNEFLLLKHSADILEAGEREREKEWTGGEESYRLKRDKETGNIIHARYYYKCETVGCKMFDKSARAGLIIDAAKDFFGQYLFVTKSNYAVFVTEAKKEAKRKLEEFDSEIAMLKVLIANKEKSYSRIKELILENPDLKVHYDLDNYAKDVQNLKADYTKAMRRRERIKDAMPTFEEYLKLLETTPVILDKIQDMKAMDTLLRIFFSNFTITPGDSSFRKGSTVSYKLKEPWEGFFSANDFVRGAGLG